MPHGGTRRLRSLVLVVVAAMGLALAVAAPAAAAAPGNDSRTTPQVIGSLPVTLAGTVVGSTLEAGEPGSCSALGGSVWYAFTPTKSRSILLALDAAGDMDAAVEVFERSRSQLSSLGCSVTDKNGEAVVDVDVQAGSEYLFRVGQLFNSVADTFTLRAVAPDDPATAPGNPLAAKGVAATVDRFANADDAWWVQMTKGRTYRVNFVTKGDGCAAAQVFPAGTKSFDSATPVRHLTCDGYTVLTAEKSGRYPILVTAPRASRTPLHYRLRAGLAQADDTAPGLPLAADVHRHGSLHGSELDAVDLYRFGIAHRSDMRIKLETKRHFEIRLMKSGGRLIASGEHRVDARLASGRYYVVVQALDGAGGSYVLSRHGRTITHAKMLAANRHWASIGSGQSVDLSLRVSPAVSGPATMLIERHDPLGGWLFVRREHPTVVGGVAHVSFRPPSLGKYRVTGTFDGTFTASRSEGGTATVSVVEPLTMSAL